MSGTRPLPRSAPSARWVVRRVIGKEMSMHSPQPYCCSMPSHERVSLRRRLAGKLALASRWALVAATMVACGRNPGRPVRVTVPPGASLGTAAESLARAGVIGSAQLFRAYAFIRRDDRAIKAGMYVLRRNSGYGTALDAIRGGKGLVRSVTIPEGFAL